MKRSSGRRAWLCLARVLVGLANLAGFLSPRALLAHESDPNLTIRILVYNYSQASPGVVARAEREAERVFNEAGMDIQWLNCPMGSGAAVPENPCAKLLDESELVLRVLAEPARNGFHEDVFGAAVFPVLASVYYEPARRSARSDNAEFESPIILGCAIAHEMGHLLLGPNAHSTGGIMQPRWERKEIRQAMWRSLSFTAEQASAMKAAARVRTRTVRAKTSANTKSGRSS